MPTIVTYNIRHGGVGREAPLCAVIRSTHPDIVVLQEAVTPAVVARLAHECELPHFQSRPGYCAASSGVWISPVGRRPLNTVPEGMPAPIFAPRPPAFHLFRWSPIPCPTPKTRVAAA